MRWLSLGLALAVLMGTVFVPSLGAAAATCQSGGDYDIDCTWPDSTACDGANSTPRSKTLPTGGILELRYDSGCRSIWGRTPSSLNEEVFVVRDSCSAGNTAGLTNQVNTPHRWSRQLNDKNCTGHATVFIGGVGYQTTSY